MMLKVNSEASLNNEKNKLCQQILNKEKNIYLLGCNKWSQDISKFINIAGFIDEFSNEDYFCGKQVIHNLLDILKENSIVISCILGRPWTVKQKLDKSGILNVDYFSFWRLSGYNLIDERNWKEFQKNFDFDSYNLLFNKLEDLESKKTLQDIINFRLTQDIDNMKFYSDKQFYQYFEPFLNIKEERFIDIGGFDGFTSELFMKLYPKFSGIDFFEPDTKNFKIAQQKLDDYKNKINFHSVGIGKKTETLKFSYSGSTSGISNEGEILVDVDSLDNIFPNFQGSEKVYIKMDIEGWELNALMGAENLIKTLKPKLAICVYHKPNDFLEIYNYVINLYSNYKIYLRHYTEGVDETVMYFIP